MATATASPAATTPRPRRSRGKGQRTDTNLTGWLFVSPMILILGLFLVVPIVMAAWVSVSDWQGAGSPFASSVNFVGADNYAKLLTEDGLARSDFMTSLRNNFFYVLLVVPLQTVLALILAFSLNKQGLKGKGFFRTAYYFPTVTSSVAIAAVFLFLFSSDGTVNAFLRFLGINGPAWFNDPRGLLHLVLGGLGVSEPAALTGTTVMGLTLWDWLAGPSVAMCAIIGLVVWTSAGGFMLMFLAGLQDIPGECIEAASIDGASRWRTIWYVVIPQLKPVLFLVVTLGLIGTWQVFDQIYIMSKGSPGKTTLTPAYLSYETSFNSGQWGQGAAMAFLLFGLIVVLTLLQRWLMRERTPKPRPKAGGRGPVSPDPVDAPAGAAVGQGSDQKVGVAR